MSSGIDIHLPASKSISNRLLILQALYDDGIKIGNLSKADDTKILQDCLKSTERVLDVGMAGTAYRFLLAYLAQKEGDYVLTGSERMRKRPIAPLVNALRSLGAKIEYMNEDGFPPLKIKGRTLEGGTVEVESGISSQFISALMLIAPKMEKGLVIKCKGERVSESYIKMSSKLMEECGIHNEMGNNQISISFKDQINHKFQVESDWSSAAFFYNYLCCARQKNQRISFSSLKRDTYQGDIAVSGIYRHLGIESEFAGNSVSIFWNGGISDKNHFDFTQTPDLIQPFLVSCAALNKNVIISGAKTLRIKETDRIIAMKSELQKIGAYLEIPDEDKLKLTSFETIPEEVYVNTYNDHRMAMSFAALFDLIPKLQIENPAVASKSFPSFWTEMKKLGISQGSSEVG